MSFLRIGARLTVVAALVSGLTVAGFGVAFADGGGGAPVPAPTVFPQPNFDCQKQQGHDAVRRWAYWDGHEWKWVGDDWAYC